MVLGQAFARLTSSVPVTASGLGPHRFEGRTQRTREIMNRRWLPPIPPEHGAKTILVVALLTPPSVSFGTGISLSPSNGIAYLLFAGIAGGALFFREAICQYLLVRPGETPWVGLVAVVEGTVLLILIGGLTLVKTPTWWFLGAVIPGVAIEAFRSHGRDRKALSKAGIGVFVLALVVPVGMVLLGFTDPRTIALVFGLFVGYHILAILRVGAVVEGVGAIRAVGLFVPIAAVVLAVAGFSLSILGLGAPIVFGLSGLRSGHLERTAGSPSFKRLGQSEALLSVVFVLSGPWLVV